jgi:steroid 5-alpha reductase family enzyme
MRFGFFHPLITLDDAMVQSFLQSASSDGNPEVVRTCYLNERKAFTSLAKFALLAAFAAGAIALYFIITAFLIGLALAGDRSAGAGIVFFTLVVLIVCIALPVAACDRLIQWRRRATRNTQALDDGFAIWQQSRSTGKLGR